jgi:hypothetical protein
MNNKVEIKGHILGPVPYPNESELQTSDASPSLTNDNITSQVTSRTYSMLCFNQERTIY